MVKKSKSKAPLTGERRPKTEKVSIACPGCGRTQILRPSKVEPCDGYYCGGCDFSPPRPPEGYGLRYMFEAAGGFRGYSLFLLSDEDKQHLERAKGLLEAGTKRLSQLN